MSNSQILCQWKRFSVIQEEHRLPDGRHIKHTKLAHPGAVVIVPITTDGKLVLVRQYRAAVSRWLLEFPAGTLEAGEDIEQCAKRELAEEVNLSAAQWQSLGEILPAPGFCDEVLYAYLARELSPAPGELDDDEIIDVVTLSVAEFEQQLQDNTLVDGKTLALYARAKAQGLL